MTADPRLLSQDRVGPVLTPGPLTDAIVAAVRALNGQVEVVHRGAYLRVTSPGRCLLTRLAVEAVLGRAFRLPGDLEAIMPSFSGRLVCGDDAAEWRAAALAPGEPP